MVLSTGEESPWRATECDTVEATPTDDIAVEVQFEVIAENLQRKVYKVAIMRKAPLEVVEIAEGLPTGAVVNAAPDQPAIRVRVSGSLSLLTAQGKSRLQSFADVKVEHVKASLLPLNNEQNVTKVVVGP